MCSSCVESSKHDCYVHEPRRGPSQHLCLSWSVPHLLDTNYTIFFCTAALNIACKPRTLDVARMPALTSTVPTSVVRGIMELHVEHASRSGPKTRVEGVSNARQSLGSPSHYLWQHALLVLYLYFISSRHGQAGWLPIRAAFSQGCGTRSAGLCLYRGSQMSPIACSRISQRAI